jgi:hypothetical protein
MANYTVKVSVQDSDGESSSFSFYLDDTVTDPAVTAQAIIEDADVLMNGFITGVGITQDVSLAGWTIKTAQAAANDRLVGGRFIWRTPEGYRTSFTLPTFDNATYVPAGSENIDQANADVTAFLATFLGQQTNTSQGIEVTAIEAAYEVHGGKK